jgi:DNA-directed RNA polymerase II subunit RPB1
MASGAGNRHGLKFSSAKTKIVKEIQFGIFSPEDIKAMSVVEVKYPEMMASRLSGS